MRACVRACVCVCVRAGVRACVHSCTHPRTHVPMHDLLEQPRIETGGNEYLMSHPSILSYLVQNIWPTLNVNRSGLCARGLFDWICCGHVMQVIVSGSNPICYCPWKRGDLVPVLGGVGGTEGFAVGMS